MPRVLLVGSSHMVRIVNHLERNPPPFPVYPAAKSGLRADQALKFLEKQYDSIFSFGPTHAILLIGSCDLLPKTIHEPVGEVRTMISEVKLVQDWLKTAFGVQVLYSELLPHAVYEEELRDMNDTKRSEQQRWRRHNLKVLHIRKTNYSDKFDNVIQHPRLWEHQVGKAKTARRALFDTTSYHYWGLHLNNDGTAILWDDFIAALQYWVPLSDILALFRATNHSKEIIHLLLSGFSNEPWHINFHISHYSFYYYSVCSNKNLNIHLMLTKEIKPKIEFFKQNHY